MARLRCVNSDFAYVLGASGDASIYHRKAKHEYCIEYEQKNAEWLEYSIRPRVSKLFGKHPAVKRRKSGLFRLRLYSKKAYSAFRAVLKHLSSILNEPKAVQRAYVKGFFDAEGSAPREKGRRIEFYQKDKRVLRIIASILRSNGIHSEKITNSRDVGQLIIRGKVNIRLFQSEIGSEHPKKSAALTAL